MLVRKSVLDMTGGFDEHFFMYGEDIDLSYRIQNTRNPLTGNNFKNYYFSETTILHFKGESTKRGSLNYVRMFYLAMSQFVQKHYSSSRAGFFNLIIKGAIWARACLSLFKQLIKKSGLPLLDGILIWLMFWISKELWTGFVKKDVQYEPGLIYRSFTGFSLLFLAVSYYTGLYQKKFRFIDLLKSGIIMLVILLAIYSLLPEYVRFSRGIVVVGSLLSLLTLGIWRKLLLYLEILEPAAAEEEKYTLVVGTKKDALDVEKLTRQSGKKSPIKGVVSPIKEENSIGRIDELEQLVTDSPVKELVFCESEWLSFGDIIQYYQQLPHHIKLRIHAKGSHSIIGSDSKFYSGETVALPPYRLAMPINYRIKRLADVIFALLLFISFPVHIFFHPQPVGLIKNIFMIIIGKRTWIGYSGSHHTYLPSIPKAVLSPSGIPLPKDTLNNEAQIKANEWYAQEYELMMDVGLMFTHYKDLGIS